MTIPSSPLKKIVDTLPGVRPRLALRIAEQRLRMVGIFDRHKVQEYPVALEKHGAYGPYIVVHPAGARLLLEMYRNGKLPMQPKAKPVDPPEWVICLAQMSDEDIVAHEAQQAISLEHLEDAYWRWVNRTCPYAPHSAEARTWREVTPFEYRGVRYTRERYVMRSNSGKSVVGGATTFYGSDGSVFGEGLVPNRRNDPNRNWGLGPE